MQTKAIDDIFLDYNVRWFILREVVVLQLLKIDNKKKNYNHFPIFFADFT